MKRSQFLQYLGVGALTTLGSSLLQSQPLAAQSGGVTVKFLGHTCFLFTGGGQRVLVNPFRQIGCTTGYRAPITQSNFVLISSRLFDEGYPEQLPGNPRVLFEAGSYKVDGWRFEGVEVDHDRVGGNRFGFNVVWRWQQGGVNIVHLGGAAGPITPAEKIPLTRPDLLFVPVGGGPKAYNASEAMAAVQELNPKIVIPTHYRTSAADSQCDLDGREAFVEQFKARYGSDAVSNRGSDTAAFNAGSFNATTPQLRTMNYRF
ncbi:MAG: MBL fold metallo-hydrolase [Spirulina sp. SIO3F2]|nr:MBL fold metallo-hydrolase [Spirulina sp. SIO3F2]